VTVVEVAGRVVVVAGEDDFLCPGFATTTTTGICAAATMRTSPLFLSKVESQ
jgi:hypothetical protein